MTNSSLSDSPIIGILYKIVCNEPLSDREVVLLKEWENASDENRKVINRISNDSELLQSIKELYSFDKEMIWLELQARRNITSLPVGNQNPEVKATNPAADEPRISLSKVERVPILRRRWVRYAATIIVLVGTGAYYWITSNKTIHPSSITDNNRSSIDIRPGSNKAILTLSDGTTILLDSVSNGELAHQGKAAIVKLNNGEIAYDLRGARSDAHPGTGEVLLNTMRTPRGGQYQLTLPDGTRIWLNAASSITYPAEFTGTQRRVTITGEAYLEVAHDKTKPFIVDVDGASTVEVVGTSFNINSYSDETSIKTTLIEGIVKVKSGNTESMLKPGQQAEIARTTDNLVINYNADINQTLAWKDGIFNFNNADLQSMMLQLSRWYDIEVQYEGAIPDKKFNGEISRDVNLSAVLSWFTKLGIENRLEGRILIIKSKN